MTDGLNRSCLHLRGSGSADVNSTNITWNADEIYVDKRRSST